MTRIEQDFYSSVIRLHKKIKDQCEVDWEQRRYEIAKEMLPYCAQTSKEVLLSGGELNGDSFAEAVSRQAIMFANTLIEELKK